MTMTTWKPSLRTVQWPTGNLRIRVLSLVKTTIAPCVEVVCHFVQVREQGGGPDVRVRGCPAGTARGSVGRLRSWPGVRRSRCRPRRERGLLCMPQSAPHVNASRQITLRYVEGVVSGIDE
jgi:hypothetical protein